MIERPIGRSLETTIRLLRDILAGYVRALPTYPALASAGKTTIALSLLALFVLCYSLACWLPARNDWAGAYRPACLRLLAGESPYAAEGSAGFFNPIWALAPLLPIAVLPPLLGRTVLILCTLLVFGYVAYRLGASPASLGILLVSYPVVFCLVFGQIDWLVALGFILPPRWGFLLVMTKPQAGVGIALYWLWEAWKKGRGRGVLHLVAPSVIGAALTAAVFLADPRPGILCQGLNLSLWPYSIPVGIALLAVAIAKRRPGHAILSAPLLSPYVMPHSLSCPLLLAGKSVGTAALFSLASWGLAALVYYLGMG